MEGFTNRNFPPTNWECNYELLRESSCLGGLLPFHHEISSFIRSVTLFSSWKWAVGITSGNSLLPGHYPTCVKHCLDFSFVFSSPLLAWRNLFSASGIFCVGRYQPGCTGIFWPAEGTSQTVTISKKVKKSELCFTWDKDLSTGPSMIWDLFLRPTDLGHRSQITEGPVLLRPFSYT